MGQVFNEEEIEQGLVIKLQKENGIFEGYVKLIDADDGGMTRIRGSNQVLIEQRWLVEWVGIAKLPVTLSDEQRITQMTQQGKRTHRRILYKTSKTHRPYTIDNNRHFTESDFDLNDDFDGLF